MTDYLSDELDSELIIGLVSAIGTEKALVIDLLKERLGRAGYTVCVVKVSSDVIPLFKSISEHNDDKFQKISDLMDAGNEARSITQDDSVLALGVATEIYALRNKDDKDLPQPLEKTAFIVDSLKRPEEVEKLRLIYPSGFILVGVHEEESRRREHLINNQGLSGVNADRLILRDAEESKAKHGQRVNKTFHLADFLLEYQTIMIDCDVTSDAWLSFGLEIRFSHPLSMSMPCFWRTQPLSARQTYRVK